MTLDTSTLHCAVYALLHCNSMKSFTHEKVGRWKGKKREGGKKNKGWGGEGQDGEHAEEVKGHNILTRDEGREM